MPGMEGCGWCKVGQPSGRSRAPALARRSRLHALTCWRRLSLQHASVFHIHRAVTGVEAALRRSTFDLTEACKKVAVLLDLD